MMRTFLLWPIAAFSLLACQPFQLEHTQSPSEGWLDERGELVDDGTQPALATSLTDSAITVTVTGNVIEFVDFFLDKELSPRFNATTDPFEFTLPFSGLEEGEHEIKVVTGIKVLNQTSTLIRYVPFTVEAAPDSTTPPLGCDQVGNNQFFGCYYNDMNLTNLAFTRMDNEINFNFERGAPAPGVGEDNFSIRWQGQFDFEEAGNYEFKTVSDDGVRLYVNDKLIIDQWSVIQGEPVTYTATATVKKGKNKIVLEYFEFDWGASVSLGWKAASMDNPSEPSDPPLDPNPGASDSATYQIDNSNFLNPERGFHDDININDGGGYGNVRRKGYTVSRALARLDSFRNGPISNEYLNRLRNNLQSVRSAGIKIALRFAYNYQNGGQDARIEIVEQHIQQLAPILREYSDIIVVLHAGFIGAWGEWHSSTEGLTTRANKKRVVDALMAALPNTRMIDIRSPWHRREVFDGQYTPVTTPFDGSKTSRLGFLNDCFLAGTDDIGTYAGDQVRDRREAAEFTRYTATTGETCSLNIRPERVACSNSIQEMSTYSWDILNAEFYAGILNGWKSQGCYDEISRRLGYRFSLERASVTASVGKGETLSLELRMRNTGFGKVFNPRPVDIVLRRKSSNEIKVIRAIQDARRQLPLGGEMKTLMLNVTLPADLAAGDYDVLISMPDAAVSLAGDPRYSVRIANLNMWEEQTGYNNLRLTTKVR